LRNLCSQARFFVRICAWPGLKIGHLAQAKREIFTKFVRHLAWLFGVLQRSVPRPRFEIVRISVIMSMILSIVAHLSNNRFTVHTSGS
jgi:hypothetical protein